MYERLYASVFIFVLVIMVSVALFMGISALRAVPHHPSPVGFSEQGMVYVLPGSVVCHEYASQSGVVTFSDCSDGGTYINPPKYYPTYQRGGYRR